MSAQVTWAPGDTGDGKVANAVIFNHLDGCQCPRSCANAPGGGDAAPLPDASPAAGSVKRGAISTDRGQRRNHNVIVQVAHDQSYGERSAPRPPWRGRLVGRLATSASTLGVFVLLIWALTTPGEYFWPSWVWLGLLIPFALVGSIRKALRAPRRRAFRVQLNVSTVVMGILIWVWLMSYTGYPWPLWPLLGLSVALVAHALALPPRPAPGRRS